jgi:hypothetical protein
MATNNPFDGANYIIKTNASVKMTMTSSENHIRRKEQMRKDEEYKQKKMVQQRASERLKVRMREDPEYKQRRIMQQRASDLRRKVRMSEDAAYKEKRVVQLRAKTAKFYQTPEGTQYYKDRYKASKQPISKILPLSIRDLPSHYMDSLIRIFKDILLAPWGSPAGIPIHTDAPGSCSPASNITRPGVTRIHFGQQSSDDDDHADRIDCGAGTGSVGTDPNNAEIRLLTAAMVELGEALRQNLIADKTMCNNKMDLDNEFNSVTAVLHMGIDAIPGSEGSSIGYHCDSIFSTDGVFSATRNTQKRHTPVVVVTLGDPRMLKMKKRKATDTKFTDDKKYGQLEFMLTSGSIFLLHPDDEQPKRRASQQFLSQFQHENVEVTKGLSLALIFRVVTSKAKVHVVDNRKELREGGKIIRLANKVCTRQSKGPAKHDDDAHKQFLERKQELEVHFGKFVRGKMEKWGWLAPAPAPASPATIAPAPVTINHVVETEETKMVCRIIKMGQEGEEDESIGFVVLKSRTKAFVDARRAIVDQAVPINMDYSFSVPILGPISVKQESSLGAMLAFLESCTPNSADVGDGSFANPVKVFLVGAPLL